MRHQTGILVKGRQKYQKSYHLYNPIYICLEPKAQGCGTIFNRFYVGSMYPYFISYRGKWVYLFCCGCNSSVNLHVNILALNVKSTHSLSYVIRATFFTLSASFIFSLTWWRVICKNSVSVNLQTTTITNLEILLRITFYCKYSKT